jgi:hypothetical protein
MDGEGKQRRNKKMTQVRQNDKEQKNDTRHNRLRGGRFSIFLFPSSIPPRINMGEASMFSQHWFWRSRWNKSTCHDLAWPSTNSLEGHVKLWHAGVFPVARNIVIPASVLKNAISPQIKKGTGSWSNRN